MSAAIKFEIFYVQIILLPFNLAVLPFPELEGRYIKSQKHFKWWQLPIAW